MPVKPSARRRRSHRYRRSHRRRSHCHPGYYNRRPRKYSAILFCFWLIAITALTQPAPLWAQDGAQTVKGLLTDNVSEKPLAGVTVSLVGLPIRTLTDSTGRYTLPKVPVGRQKISFSSVGYKPVIIPEVLVTAGKEVILDLSLEQNIAALKDITITAFKTKKGMASNEFATGSARSFNMNEVTRYAGGRNDPSRLVSNFAGVSTGDDSRNDIIVRGNSPTALLWRMEGIPIPNPNHFATLGTTGGPVSALNTNALKTADFYTGAFPAEFGNARAAVFDLSLRTGNKDKFEQTYQLNLFSGLEAMVEGPLNNKKNGASFLVGYRYSFAEIAQAAGFNIGTKAVPHYQDLVFNLDFGKGRLGSFSIFGLGGLSNIDFIGKDLKATDLFANQDEDAYYKSRIGILGIKHRTEIGADTYWKTVLSYSYNSFGGNIYRYYDSLSQRQFITDVKDVNNSFRLSSFINSKVNTRLSLRGGALAEVLGDNSFARDHNNTPVWVIHRDEKSHPILLQPYLQGKYRFSDKLTVTAGLHGLYYSFSRTGAIEPRASLSYQVAENGTISLSYGLHSQLQPMDVYLYQDSTGDRSNRQLDLTRAQHYVLGYDWRFAPDWRLKWEVYYQYLYKAPVERIPTGFSVLNAGADYNFPEKAGLVNKGTGANRGIELTLEKFFSRGFYVLTTLSLFDATYKGSDGVERNSTFNNRYVANILAGKEFRIGSSKLTVFTIDWKLATSGGRYTTPVDLAASIAEGREEFDENSYNSQRQGPYFRTDLRLGFRRNSARKKLVQTFYLDLQNLTNHQNEFASSYNEVLKRVGTIYQIGFFPDILYRIEF
ncbi:MAG TPA: TonB-dependent receptor [Puia sp.]|nr:TonB-dependent receptor [Puia sp.]